MISAIIFAYVKNGVSHDVDHWSINNKATLGKCIYKSNWNIYEFLENYFLTQFIKQMSYTQCIALKL